MGRTIVFVFLLALAGALADATPMIEIHVDVNPMLPGIQYERIVAFGTSFSVDVVVIGDGVTPYDAANVDIPFNDAGAVLSFTGPIVAGSLAAPVVLELGTSAFVTPGMLLTPLGSAPSPSFANSIGGAGYVALGGPFPLAGPFVIYNATFFAAAPGASTLGISGGTGPELAFAGNPVPKMNHEGTITVVPEPGVLALLGVGFLAMLALRRVS